MTMQPRRMAQVERTSNRQGDYLALLARLHISARPGLSLWTPRAS